MSTPNERGSELLLLLLPLGIPIMSALILFIQRRRSSTVPSKKIDVVEVAAINSVEQALKNPTISDDQIIDLIYGLRRELDENTTKTKQDILYFENSIKDFTAEYIGIPQSIKNKIRRGMMLILALMLGIYCAPIAYVLVLIVFMMALRRVLPERSNKLRQKSQIYFQLDKYLDKAELLLLA